MVEILEKINTWILDKGEHSKTTKHALINNQIIDSFSIYPNEYFLINVKGYSNGELKKSLFRKIIFNLNQHHA